MAKNIVSKLTNISQSFKDECNECRESGDFRSVTKLAKYIQYGLIDNQGILQMANEIRTKAGAMDKTKVLPVKVEKSEQDRKIDADYDNTLAQGNRSTSFKDLRFREMLVYAFSRRHPSSDYLETRVAEMKTEFGLSEDRK